MKNMPGGWWTPPGPRCGFLPIAMSRPAETCLGGGLRSGAPNLLCIPVLPAMGLCLTVPMGTAGLALASHLGREVIRADHGEGFLPARSHFAPLYLARYEYGIALKMIHIDIPLSSRITSTLVAGKAALALTEAPVLGNTKPHWWLCRAHPWDAWGAMGTQGAQAL